MAIPTNLVSCLGDGDRGADLGGTSSVNDPVVSNQISNDADRIVQCSLCFIDNLSKDGQLCTTRARRTYHLVTASNKHRHRPRVCAFLDNQHLFSCRTKRQFPHDTRRSQFIRCQVFESRNDSTVGRDGDQFDFRTSHPSNGGEIILHQEVVGFVVEAPLADDKVSTSVLDPESMYC